MFRKAAPRGGFFVVLLMPGRPLNVAVVAQFAGH